jgi:pectin methylesterase-like acyl-CoA thioesterase
MRSMFSRKWRLGFAMASGLALIGCSDNGSNGRAGSSHGSTVLGGSGGKSSQGSTTGGTPGSGPGGTTAGNGGATGSGGISSGQGGAATGGSGKGGSAGEGAGSGGTNVQGGADGTLSSGGTTAAGGRSGSGGTITGGTTGAGGVTGQGGSGGNRDAGIRDGASTGDGGTGGRSGTGGNSGSGGATGGALTGGNGSGGAGAGGSGTGGSYFSTPCPGATQTFTVGSGQQYASVQAAINAVPSGNSKLVQVSVKAGKYKEQVTINKPFVCLTGESATTTTITNALGTNIVTGGTVIVTGNDFSAANIAFENTGGDGSGQAVAFMAQGQRQQFRSCRFLSYQDTLYTNTGTQYFRDCFIQGDTDYIFGDATAVFENCTMNNVAEGTAVTAPRTPQNAAYGFVFLGGSLTASPTTMTVRNNHVYLGRPWGPYAAAAFLNVAMGAHIATDGWTTMSDNTLAQTHFWEYKSTGAGANPSNGTRSSRQLSDSQAANYTVAKVLSSWTPSYSR